jgi:hypothetical protein
VFVLAAAFDLMEVCEANRRWFDSLPVAYPRHQRPDVN